MKEYIERAAVLESLGYEESRRGDILPGSTFDIILKEPAADVAEVRHGRWEYVPGTLNTYSQLRCTVCGWWTLDTSVDGVYHYCPNCGCQMNKEA